MSVHELSVPRLNQGGRGLKGGGGHGQCGFWIEAGGSVIVVQHQGKELSGLFWQRLVCEKVSCDGDIDPTGFG